MMGDDGNVANAGVGAFHGSLAESGNCAGTGPKAKSNTGRMRDFLARSSQEQIDRYVEEVGQLAFVLIAPDLRAVVNVDE